MAKRRASKKPKATERSPVLPLRYLGLASDELVRDAEAPTHGNQVLWRIERLLVDIRDELRGSRRPAARKVA